MGKPIAEAMYDSCRVEVARLTKALRDICRKTYECGYGGSEWVDSDMKQINEVAAKALNGEVD